MPDPSIRLSTAALGLSLALAAGAAPAADWPQWRGPMRDAKSSETGLLGEWPAGGPPLAYQAKGLGAGFSSLAVVGDRIYTMGDLSDGQYVLCLSRTDGSRIWGLRIGSTWEDQYGGPRATPTVDGEQVFAMNTQGSVVALSAAEGELQWSRSLVREFGGELMKAGGSWDWRWAESPLVDGGRVIVSPGAADAAVVALDRATGEELWRAALPAEMGEEGLPGAGYSSAVVSEAGGVRQYVQLLGKGVIGIEAATGKVLWSYNRVANEVANIPTPLVAGDHIFTSTGYGTGAALLTVKRNGEGMEAEEVYFLAGDEMQNHHGGMILHDGYVYAGTGHNRGFPLAVNLESGEIAWGPERNEGQGSGALVFADGRLYFRYQNGVMVLAEATPEGYHQRGSFKIPKVKNPSWSHPVVSGGRLYLREQDDLYVYDLTTG
jgi:outer membrane protein assembly factor BamB